MRSPLILHLLLALIRRLFLCPLGVHQHRERHRRCVYCGHGRGDYSGPEWRAWRVTLSTGEGIRVLALNEHHAKTQVIYGPGPGSFDGRTGEIRDPVRVHPANIATVVLEPSPSPQDLDALRAAYREGSFLTTK